MKLLVCGNVNVETSVPVEGFPLEYQPVNYLKFQTTMRVGGVGFNVAKALKTLGSEVHFAALTAPDLPGQVVRQEIKRSGLPLAFLSEVLSETPQAVVLHDPAGRRQIFTDLKDLPDRTYSQQLFHEALQGTHFAVMTNAPFVKPLVQDVVGSGVPFVTDVQDLQSLHHEYNLPFLEHAEVLFFSHEKMPEPPAEFAPKLARTYGTEVIVVGLGEEGALLYQDRTLQHVPAYPPAVVRSTVGAGDALCACFTHFYARGMHPLEALQRAVVFAGVKISTTGGSEGFLNETQLESVFSTLQHG
ncbi:carbohydrate kinase family protein [Deinococcus cellulosilyticus]|uniref:Tagatose-6-phosphate kinase n=1 Tax=Deinococcus cellulosilyticus (strain DSM 18568 / NBRC 106333 / KACC 11606 / 5516J-15) TaxID=1223518 RepID=A0A511N3A1_DEIC1|nr:carbohydrate kinase family protein [Deinococcus cellulosilyticus]GEM46977.1 tagatose-6-phosphate kinase [Deinococcus cellulosilyticus NBRC 106333 = KACC 11606]